MNPFSLENVIPTFNFNSREGHRPTHLLRELYAETNRLTQMCLCSCKCAGGGVSAVQRAALN